MMQYLITFANKQLIGEWIQYAACGVNFVRRGAKIYFWIPICKMVLENGKVIYAKFRQLILDRKSHLHWQLLCSSTCASHLVLWCIWSFSFSFFSNLLAMLACKLYKELQREVAALKIQKNLWHYDARKSYLNVWSSAITLHTNLTVAMNSNSENQTKAAIIIQVLLPHSAI